MLQIFAQTELLRWNGFGREAGAKRVELNGSYPASGPSR